MRACVCTIVHGHSIWQCFHKSIKTRLYIKALVHFTIRKGEDVSFRDKRCWKLMIGLGLQVSSVAVISESMPVIWAELLNVLPLSFTLFFPTQHWQESWDGDEVTYFGWYVWLCVFLNIICIKYQNMHFTCIRRTFLGSGGILAFNLTS